MTFQHKYKDSRNPRSVAAGLEFQDFVVDKCDECFGIKIQLYSSHRWQTEKGESRDRTEIKLDQHATNGRLSIEVYEKQHEDQLFWMESGILRPSFRYIQGNTIRFWVFDTVSLLRYFEDQVPEIVENTPTIRSFFLPCVVANRMASHIWTKEEE